MRYINIDTSQLLYSIGIVDAKKCWLETCIEKNIPIPNPTDEEAYSGNFRIRMPKTLHKDIAGKAAKEGISMNQYCIYLLSKEFTREHIQK